MGYPGVMYYPGKNSGKLEDGEMRILLMIRVDYLGGLFGSSFRDKRVAQKTSRSSCNEDTHPPLNDKLIYINQNMIRPAPKTPKILSFPKSCFLTCLLNKK